MKVLIACEFSGTVREAFARRGHDAWSCDTLPTEVAGQHYECDVREVLGLGWDLMVAHPPCTYLANSGVRWLYEDSSRWALLDDGARFFKEILEAPIPRIAVENPIMHKHARERIGGIRQDQVIQPWMFGHAEQKATCLWLKGLNPLRPTHNVKHKLESFAMAQRQRVHYMSPSKNRWRERSRTYQGIAEAMAEQWGG